MSFFDDIYVRYRNIRRSIAKSLFRRRMRDRFLKAAYYCAALQGESNYNICINSDLTVSCNCRDYAGRGIIGDLRQNSLEEIFAGETARRFRQHLAEGRFAVPECADCWEMKPVSPGQAQSLLESFHPPVDGIMVENTSRCNLRCRACAREVLRSTRRQDDMSLDDIDCVAREIARIGIREVAFHNLGEPFLSRRILDELRILRDRLPEVHLYTSTNGVLLDSHEKREAALHFDLIYFSIDGPDQETLEKYQAGGNFQRAYDNLRQLVVFRHERGHKTPVIEWKYVLFRWNDHPEHIERAIALARDAGADLISFWPGGNLPGQHLSKRYHEDPYYQSLGTPSWKGREVRFE